MTPQHRPHGDDASSHRCACTHCAALQSSARRQATTALIVSAVALFLGAASATSLIVPHGRPLRVSSGSTLAVKARETAVAKQAEATRQASRAVDLVLRAHRLSEAGEHAQALALFAEARTLAPQNTEIARSINHIVLEQDRLARGVERDEEE